MILITIPTYYSTHALLYPTERGYTYKHQNGAARLDRFYITSDRIDSIPVMQLNFVPFSYHACITIDLKWTCLNKKEL